MTRVLARVATWLALALATGGRARHLRRRDAAARVRGGRTQPDAGHARPGRLPDRRLRRLDLAPGVLRVPVVPRRHSDRRRHDAGLPRAGRRHRPRARTRGDRPLRPGHRRLRRDRDDGPQDRRHAHPRRPAGPPGPRPDAARLDGDLVHDDRAAVGHRRRHGGGVQEEGRGAQGARPRGGDPWRVVRADAVEARAIWPHLRDGLLPRLRRGRGELLPVRRGDAAAVSRTSPAPPPRTRPGPARPRRPGSRRAVGRSAAGRRGCTAPPGRARRARRR